MGKWEQWEQDGEVRDAEVLERLKPVVGQHIVAYCKRALAEDCRVWIFTSREQVAGRMVQISDSERQLCLNEANWQNASGWLGGWVAPGWAGFIRLRRPPVVLLFPSLLNASGFR